MAAKSKFPRTLGACIDLAYNARAERLDMEREFEERIKDYKDHEAAIKEHIIATFNKSDIEGARGEIATASVTRTTVPQVKDWPAVFKYIEKTHAWDLMEKRMARIAYRDRLDDNEVIPGVEPFVKIDLSLTKVAKK